VRKDESAKNRHHERIRALIEKAVDPKLEAAVKREFRAEDFVLRKDQEQHADGDAQEGQRAFVEAFLSTGFGHRGIVPQAETSSCLLCLRAAPGFDLTAGSVGEETLSVCPGSRPIPPAEVRTHCWPQRERLTFCFGLVWLRTAA
jgi:hypothetical protein